MPIYRRNLLLGGSYFFTVNLADRRLMLLTGISSCCGRRFAVSGVRHSFTIDAAVILPDHLHMIWTLPEDDEDCALGWRLIKSAFSRGLPPVVSPLGAARDLSRRLAAGDEAHPFGER